MEFSSEGEDLVIQAPCKWEVVEKVVKTASFLQGHALHYGQSVGWMKSSVRARVFVVVVLVLVIFINIETIYLLLFYVH